jgi:hypothetical protein
MSNSTKNKIYRLIDLAILVADQLEASKHLDTDNAEVLMLKAALELKQDLEHNPLS